jgi:hypothetical protein
VSEPIGSSRTLRERVATILGSRLTINGDPPDVWQGRAADLARAENNTINVFSPSSSDEGAGGDSRVFAHREVLAIACVVFLPVLKSGADNASAPDTAETLKARDKALIDLVEDTEAAIREIILGDTEIARSFRAVPSIQSVKGAEHGGDRPYGAVQITLTLEALWGYDVPETWGVEPPDLSVVHVKTHTGDDGTAPASLRVSGLES